MVLGGFGSGNVLGAIQFIFLTICVGGFRVRFSRLLVGVC